MYLSTPFLRNQTVGVSIDKGQGGQNDYTVRKCKNNSKKRGSGGRGMFGFCIWLFRGVKQCFDTAMVIK